ncbi:MAG: hypothetical protein ACYS8W_16610 [Planctomycetota bacterium]|jgi:hypothetical protein
MASNSLIEHAYWAQRTGHVNGLPISVASKVVYSLFYLHLYRGAEATRVTGSFVSHGSGGKWNRESTKPFGGMFDRVLFELTYDVIALDRALSEKVEAKFASDGNMKAVEFRINVGHPIKIPPLALQADKYSGGFEIQINTTDTKFIEINTPEDMFSYLRRRFCLCGGGYMPNRFSPPVSDTGKRITVLSAECSNCRARRDMKFDTSSPEYGEAVNQGLSSMAKNLLLPPDPAPGPDHDIGRQFVEMHKHLLSDQAENEEK